MKRFSKKVVLITGAAEGIGKNIARAFGQEGAIVAACDINEKALYDLDKEFKEKNISHSLYTVDLSLVSKTEELVAQILKDHGKLDCLVNNARSGQRFSFEEETERSWNKTVSVTLNTVFFLSRAVIQQMQKNGGGTIVNIASVAGLYVGHDSPSYHVAKAAVIQLTKYLALNAGPYNIRVNAISPGFIVKDEDQSRYNKPDNFEFRKTAEFSQSIRQVGSSDDIAQAVLFLSSSDAKFITGENLIVDGGLTIQDQSGILYRFKKYSE